MINKKILSIIIPVYNGSSTVNRLLDSIFIHDLEEVEVILLNDGSTDDLRDKIRSDFFEKNQFVYVEKENSGVSDTRNMGIKKANADYITFADCDDFYEVGTLNHVIDAIKAEDIELLCFNYFNTYSNNTKKKMLNFTQKSENLSESEGIENYLNGKYFTKYNNAVWNKVFKRKILLENSICFDVTKKIGEDLLFNIEYFLNIKRISLLNVCVYNYFQQENSVMRRYNHFFINDIKEYLPALNRIVNKYHIDIDNKNFAFFFLTRFFGLLNNESIGNSYNTGLINLKEFRSFFNENNFFEKIGFTQLNFKYKLFYCILKYKLYNIVYTILYFKNKLI